MHSQIYSQMNKLLFLALVISITSCTCNNNDIKLSNDGAATMPDNVVEGLNIHGIVSAKKELLPDMCDLVPKSYIAEVLGLDNDAVTLNNSSQSGANPKHKTCFFKWTDPNFPNTGIMLQAMRNPLPDEFPEYLTTFIQSKRENGENALGDEFVHYFKDFRGVGDEGIYNADIGKYFWRYSDLVVFQLAFNSIHEQDEQLAIASKLATRMSREYLGTGSIKN